jgi:hypothetical protein
MAVRAVKMTSLNRQRANIALSALLDSDPDLDLNLLKCNRDSEGKRTKSGTSTLKKQVTCKSLRPEEVSSRERIFERDGLLRWTASSSLSSQQILGFCQIGVSLQNLVVLVVGGKPSFSSATSTLPAQPILHHLITRTFTSEAYLLYLSPHYPPPFLPLTSRRKTLQASIVLKKGCTPMQQLKAWTHALLAARVLLSPSSSATTNTAVTTATTTSAATTATSDKHSTNGSQGSILDVITSTLDFLNQEKRFEGCYVPALLNAGWNLDLATLETRPERRRVEISSFP